jgi:hypothetical protein
MLPGIFANRELPIANLVQQKSGYLISIELANLDKIRERTGTEME